ncbi:polymerase [Thermohalobacter berrensis]|uniref:Polymerase n=1 Tax=Thermohalobacter berrensis TaxID=99594 RepID=A0A419SXU8_9FIRM|nr:polymerase [Thermohalobacter berrensis]
MKLIGGIVAAILSIYNINIGIMLVIFSLPFVSKINSLMFAIFIVCVFLFKLFCTERYSLRKSFLDVPIIVYVIIILITTVTSYNPQGSFRDLAIHLSAIGLVFVIVNIIKNKNQLNIILTTFIFTATIVALYGLYQYKVGVKIDDAWVDVANNPSLRTRIFSVFGNPNILAEYLIMAIPVSLSFFWVSKKIYKKAIFSLTTIILTLALILTFSRGGWLGFAFSMFIFVLLIEKRLLLSLIPFGIISFFAMPSSILHRIMTIGNLKDSSNAYRIKVWDITLDIIKDNWISGVGFGYIPFRETFVKYIRTMNVYHAHNTYLETMAELGIGGLIVLLILIFINYKYSILNLMKTEDRYIKVISAGVLAGLSAILFHGLVENILYLPRIIITFWTLIAFNLVILNISSSKSKCNKLD